MPRLITPALSPLKHDKNPVKPSKTAGAAGDGAEGQGYRVYFPIRVFFGPLRQRPYRHWPHFMSFFIFIYIPATATISRFFIDFSLRFRSGRTKPTRETPAEKRDGVKYRFKYRLMTSLSNYVAANAGEIPCVCGLGGGQ